MKAGDTVMLKRNTWVDWEMKTNNYKPHWIPAGLYKVFSAPRHGITVMLDTPDGVFALPSYDIR